MEIKDTLPSRTYTPDNGDFTVTDRGSEVMISRYQHVVLQNHDKCQELRELRDIINVILGEGK